MKKFAGLALAANVTELAIGDRVLVTLEPGTTNVRRIVIMAATDIGAREEADRRDWNARGVSRNRRHHERQHHCFAGSIAAGRNAPHGRCV